MKNIDVVLASNNSGKLQEFSALFTPLKFNIQAQNKLNISSIDETGLSFIENSLIKARHASKLSKMPAIADDSGLVIPALDGAPGIFSARYSGKDANDQNNIDYLLTKMKDIKDRQAYFYCALVFIRHPNDPTPIIATGTFNGVISFQQHGQQGFGYDPIFYIPEYQQTAAEMSKQQKNSISHRAIASQKLLQQIKDNFKNT